jgi:uncharacterized protein YdaU (DUF1376 family)
MYPADFEADTSHLTLEEDGAYNRLLRLCWMTPGCSLPDDPAWIARRMRLSAADFQRVVAPLLDEFFKRARGRVFSPRLTREWEKVDETSRRRSEAGKKGGRPKAIENKQNEQKAGFDFDKAGPKQPEPEPEPLRERGKPLSSAPDGFEEFWSAVPRKVAKDKAMPAYARALRKADARTLISAMRRYAQSRIGEDPKYTAHPASWLNAGRWEDEPEPMTGGNHGNSKGERRIQSWLAGASIAPPVDCGPDIDASLPLLARR